MKVSELKAEMDQLFEQVDRRFEQVDRRFEQVDQRFVELEKRVSDEGKKTRLHFDIVAEQMKQERNLALDLAMATLQRLDRLAESSAAGQHVCERRLDDHERRISVLEAGPQPPDR